MNPHTTEEGAMTTTSRTQINTALDAQHTPGPWTAHDDDGTGTLPCVLAQQPTAGNFYVAQCNVFADARLIAAAPTLLAALRLVLDNLDNMTTDEFARGADKHARDKARAAIRKATDAA